MHSQHLKTPIVPVGLLVLFALCSTVFATRAQAGEVHFDPESPAGKEYALPLQQARNEALGTGGGEAGGGQGGSGGTGATAPLFGVGVGGGNSNAAGPSEGGGTGQRSDQDGTRNQGNRSEGEGSEGSAAQPSLPPDPAAVATAEAAGYSTGQGLLLLAGILVLGIALGFGLRASGRHRAATS